MKYLHTFVGSYTSGLVCSSLFENEIYYETETIPGLKETYRFKVNDNDYERAMYILTKTLEEEVSKLAK